MAEEGGKGGIAYLRRKAPKLMASFAVGLGAAADPAAPPTATTRLLL